MTGTLVVNWLKKELPIKIDNPLITLILRTQCTFLEKSESYFKDVLEVVIFIVINQFDHIF